MNSLYALLSFVSVFVAFLFVSGAFLSAESAPQQATFLAGACFFGIMARIFQAQSVIEADKKKERNERLSKSKSKENS